jgi:hypothetical protein
MPIKGRLQGQAGMGLTGACAVLRFGNLCGKAGRNTIGIAPLTE